MVLRQFFDIIQNFHIYIFYRYKFNSISLVVGVVQMVEMFASFRVFPCFVAVLPFTIRRFVVGVVVLFFLPL